MTAEREQQIIAALQAIVSGFESSEHEPELTMFALISRYNERGDNPELIGGDWAAEHGFDLPS